MERWEWKVRWKCLFEYMTDWTSRKQKFESFRCWLVKILQAVCLSGHEYENCPLQPQPRHRLKDFMQAEIYWHQQKLANIWRNFTKVSGLFWKEDFWIFFKNTIFFHYWHYFDVIGVLRTSFFPIANVLYIVYQCIVP